ncbi:YaaL family protein [Exiguobacterium sp. SL14]|nr:YaaL family protein [Exiguobacterium sp. SL14]MCY1689493.1 YaaL family protein [Exiguobacterium sp. SL14]
MQWRDAANYELVSKKIRSEYDQRLLEELAKAKEDYLMKRHLLEISYDDYGDLEAQMKLAESLYFFYISEAKRRRVSLMMK